MVKVKKKIAFITGITGQDGSYLAELLIKKNYSVYGLTKPKGSKNNINISKIKNNIIIKNLDINKSPEISNLIKKIKPDEFYHLAAQSFVNYKFEDEFFTLNPNINGTHYILSSIKKFSPKTKFYFAASSELFGNTKKKSVNELSNFNPRSAYGISKLAGFHLTKNYREAYGLFSCSGILFNHESGRRSTLFVTRKIINNLVKIKFNKIKSFNIGNLDAKRDWGHAKDYVYAMWKMLQQKKAEDFVIGSGKLHSVRQFIDISSNLLGIKYKQHIKINKKIFRKNDHFFLKADPSKAFKKLKWKPKYNFKNLIIDMIVSEIKNLKINIKHDHININSEIIELLGKKFK
tara:strand:+ start:405 stop:1445 length:1041 start_codon:yes stop_codon:yes gene_type:complete